MIAPLELHHDRKSFRCGDPALDSWLRRAPVAGVFAALEGDQVIGFYALSAFTFAVDDHGHELKLALPKDREGAVPVARLTRLARDRRKRGQQLGELLLADALARVLDHAPQVFAIAADAPSEPARRFYGQFGFTCLPSQPERMLLLASTAAKARELPPRKL